MRSGASSGRRANPPATQAAVPAYAATLSPVPREQMAPNRGASQLAIQDRMATARMLPA